MIKEYRQLYRGLLRLGVSRENALNIVLVKMGLKDATTVGFKDKLLGALKARGFRCEIDVSYVSKRIRGVVELSTKVRLPGAEVSKRLYVGYRIPRERLKRLMKCNSFEEGQAFGFPICDTIYFCRKNKSEAKSYIRIFQDWIENIPAKNGFKYIDFRLTSGLVKYFEPIRIITHIPHSYDCPASLGLSERNLNILEQLDPGFKKHLIKEFKKPILLYGNNWEDMKLMQVRELKKINSGIYTAGCSASVPRGFPRDVPLTIKLTPHKKVEMYIKNRKILEQKSAKKLPWSYCVIFPYDSME